MNRYSTVGQRRHSALVAAVFSACVAAPAAAQQLRLGGLPLNLHGVAIADGAVSVAAAETPSAVTENTPALAETPAQDAAQTQSDSATMSFFKNTEVSGFVDTYYSYNGNTPATRKAGLERNFDVQHNSFSLNLLELALEKKPTADSRGGFRFDLDFGPTQGIVNAAEPGDRTLLQNIGQAYLSYLAPAGNGLQIDIGKFVTPLGNEVIKTKDNWNYSRSLLFALAIPYYHMGVRATYSVSDKFTLAGFLVNGWNNVVDNNTGKTVAVQATVKPLPALTIAETYIAGPEQTDDNADWRHVSDTVATFTVTPKVSLAANYDYGQDKESGATVKWQGIAGYLRFQPTAWFALSPRAEYYNDRDGFTTGMAQKLKEFTLTAEVKPKDGMIMRLEYRRDVSDIGFFLKNAAENSPHQNTFTIGFIYAFSTKAP
jgi:Putative beta-barrel porin-2, OmpL-like. bbp2